jgi:hypothetical protein
MHPSSHERRALNRNFRVPAGQPASVLLQGCEAGSIGGPQAGGDQPRLGQVGNISFSPCQLHVIVSLSVKLNSKYVGSLETLVRNSSFLALALSNVLVIAASQAG